MIAIRGVLYDLLCHTASHRLPNEMCGVLVADVEEPEIVFTFVEITNISDNPTRGFVVDPAEQLDVWRDYHTPLTRIIAVVHSHTMGRPVPSDDDIENHDPSLLMGIIDATGDDRLDLGLWRIRSDGPEPVGFEIIHNP